jgi:hypothetical protein
MGGLWKDVTITDDDIAAVRREMWEGTATSAGLHDEACRCSTGNLVIQFGARACTKRQD